MSVDFNRLKDSCNILDVWRSLNLPEPVQKGANLKARCIRPQNHSHGDNDPSLVLGGKKNIAWCPVCDLYWDSITLVAEIAFGSPQESLQNDTYYKACVWLGKVFLNGRLPMKDGGWEDIADSSQINNPPALKLRRDTQPPSFSRLGRDSEGRPTPSFEPLTEKDIAFLNTYGLSQEIILSSKLGSYNHPTLGPGIIYPVPPENPRAFKFKSISRDEKGKRSCLFLEGDKTALFGEETIRTGQILVITGGEEKCLLLHQLGFPAVSTLFGEGSFYDNQAEKITSDHPSRVVLALDADNAGREGQNKIGRKLLDSGIPGEILFGVSWPGDLPTGYDLNNLFQDKGADAVKSFIASAPKLTPTLFCSIDAREDCWEMDKIQAMDISWLWEPWIPRGMITILTGDPNSGKTWLALQICAIISKGYNFPDPETGFPPECRMLNSEFGINSAFQNPHSAIYITYEDNIRVTIKNRLDTMDCDQSNILIPKNLDGCLRLDRPDRIEALLRKYEPKVLIFDPLTAALGERTKMNAAEDVTRLLSPIVRLVESYNCALILIRHQAKADRDKVLDRGLGSIAFSGMARSEILLGRNPEDLSKRVLFLIKCSEREAQAIPYKCDGFFEWCGLSDLTPQDLGKAVGNKSHQNTTKDQASEWLQALLADGPVMMNKILEQAEKHDPPFSLPTLKRVKKELGVESLRITEGNNGNGTWIWKLSQGDM